MNLIEATFDPDLNQHPTVIFEKEKKEETAEAEKRLNDQAKEQKDIEARILKRQKETSNKPQPPPI